MPWVGLEVVGVSDVGELDVGNSVVMSEILDSVGDIILMFGVGRSEVDRFIWGCLGDQCHGKGSITLDLLFVIVDRSSNSLDPVSSDGLPVKKSVKKFETIGKIGNQPVPWQG